MSVRFRPTSEPSRSSSPRDTAPGRPWQTLPHIRQLRPDGADKGYRNGAYNCAPTVVAMVARGLGKASGMKDAQLIDQLGRGIVNAEGATPRGVARMLARGWDPRDRGQSASPSRPSVAA